MRQIEPKLTGELICPQVILLGEGRVKLRDDLGSILTSSQENYYTTSYLNEHLEHLAWDLVSSCVSSLLSPTSFSYTM